MLTNPYFFGQNFLCSFSGIFIRPASVVGVRTPQDLKIFEVLIPDPGKGKCKVIPLQDRCGPEGG